MWSDELEESKKGWGKNRFQCTGSFYSSIELENTLSKPEKWKEKNKQICAVLSGLTVLQNKRENYEQKWTLTCEEIIDS